MTLSYEKLRGIQIGYMRIKEMHGLMKVIAIAIVVVLALSMFSGYLFYAMAGGMRLSPSMTGLGYYPSVEVVAERTVAPGEKVEVSKAEGGADGYSDTHCTPADYSVDTICSCSENLSKS